MKLSQETLDEVVRNYDGDAFNLPSRDAVFRHGIQRAPCDEVPYAFLAPVRKISAENMTRWLRRIEAARRKSFFVVGCHRGLTCKRGVLAASGC